MSDSLLDRFFERNRWKLLGVFTFIFFFPVALVAWLIYGLWWFLRPPWWAPVGLLTIAALAAWWIGPTDLFIPGLGWSVTKFFAWMTQDISETLKQANASMGGQPVAPVKPAAVPFAEYFTTGKVLTSAVTLGTLAGSIPAVWQVAPRISPKPLTSEQKQRAKDFTKSKLNDWLVKRAQEDYERRRKK